MKIPEYITFIEKNSSLNIKQAFVADSDDSNRLNTGRNWAKFRSINKNEKNYNEYTYKNEDLKLTIYESPQYSSNGGKLSFCNCIITAHDGKQFSVGINTDYLFDLFKECTIEKGTIKEKLMFAFDKNRTFMVFKDSQIYNNIINECLISKNYNNLPKTTKRKFGYIYSSKTKSAIYLGSYYSQYKVCNKYFSISSDSTYYIQKLITPIKVNLYYNLNNNNLQDKLSDFCIKNNLYLTSNSSSLVEKQNSIIMDISMEEFIKRLNAQFLIDPIYYCYIPYILNIDKSDAKLPKMFENSKFILV